MQHRMRHLLLNALAFAMCYLSANQLAWRQGVVRHIALPFEAAIPFLPWMIIPYLSSGVFFCLVFFMAGSQNQVRIFSQRMLLATVLASLVFVIFPLQFSWHRPAIHHQLLAFLYEMLGLMDKPYNQLPSLHVAFCILFWHTLRLQLPPGTGRIFLAGWLALMAASTLFTYQHHVLDIVGGIALALFCMQAVARKIKEPQVAFYYLMLAGITLVAGVFFLHSWLALYVMGCLLLVSLAYWRRDANFMHKTGGRHPWWIWVLYAPYLIGYQLTWLAVMWRERRKPVMLRLTEQLWVGRRLNAAEAMQLPADCCIIDLGNELSETPLLRTHSYWHYPLLDLLTPPPDAVAAILQRMREEITAGNTVYLHCAMGYSRGILLAKLYMSQGTILQQ